MIIDNYSRTSTLHMAIDNLEYILNTFDEYKKYKGLKMYREATNGQLIDFREYYEFTIFGDEIYISLSFYKFFAYAEFESFFAFNDKEVTAIKIKKILKNLKEVVEKREGRKNV